MAATTKKRTEVGPGLYRCSVCKRALSPDKFLAIVVKDKRCKPGHSRKTFSYDCRACRNEAKRDARRKKAAAVGRALLAPGEWQRVQKAARAARKKDRRIAWGICLAFRALTKRTREQAIARSVARQRERYNTDPAYQAERKALKIRRKRAQKGTQIMPVNREIVARRDGWCCGICGGKVTRQTWSLDHVVPLSKGGSHTYGNVVLAHRSCNSKRGPGRLPVQPSLFPIL